MRTAGSVVTALVVVTLSLVAWSVATIVLATVISGAIAPLGSVEVGILAVVVAVAISVWVRSHLRRVTPPA